MSAYRSTVKGSTEFDGEEVCFELRRISYADALALGDKTRAEASDVIREHVMLLNVKDADGAIVPVETVFRDFYFAPLVGKLSLALMATGRVTKAQADPSDGSSPTSSPGDGSQKE